MTLFPTLYRRLTAHSVMAVGRAQLQQIDQAIEECEIFLSLATKRQDKAIGHMVLAKVCGSALLAQKHLQKSYELNPNGDEIQQQLDSIQTFIQQNAAMINQSKEEENPLKLQFLQVMGAGMMLMVENKDEDAYQILKNCAEVYANAAVAKNHLIDIPIPPSKRSQAIDFLERQGCIAKTGIDEYAITNLGLFLFYYALGTLHYDNQNYQQAAECYAQAYIMDGTEHPLLQHQARCYIELKEWDKAINQLELLLFEEPNNLNAYPPLAEAYGKAYEATQNEKYRIKGRESLYRLRTACQRVLAEDPDNETATSILEKLSELKDEVETAPPTTPTAPTESDTSEEQLQNEKEEQRLREQERKEKERQEIEQRRIREVHRKQGLCVKCGAKLSLFDKMRGKTRCKQHR